MIKSLLSIPIFDGEKAVIGVMQMINKLNGKPFAENDRNSLEVQRISFCVLLFAAVSGGSILGPGRGQIVASPSPQNLGGPKLWLGYAPKFSRTLDTVGSIDSLKNR